MIDRNCKSTEDILNFLGEGKIKEQAEEMLLFAEENSLRKELKITAKYYSFTFYPECSGRALFKLDINDRTVRIKAQLFFIDEHIEDAEKLSEPLKEMIRKTPACTRCSLNCKQGVSFHLDGKDYFSCINEGHYFKDLSMEQLNEIKGLLKAENSFIMRLKQ